MGNGSLSSVPAFSFKGAPAAQRQVQKTFLVRIAHPNEEAVTALLEDVATGGEDVANKIQEALRLLKDDGIFASFSTMQLRDGGVSDEPYVDYQTGLIGLPKNQFLLYGRKPGDYGDEGQVIFKSWNDSKSKAGFVGAFMAWANSAYRAAIGLPPAEAAQRTREQIPAGHAAPGVGGSEVRLR